jgi:hypothetical protein
VKRRLRWALCAFLGPLSLHGAELVPQDFAFAAHHRRERSIGHHGPL